MLFGIIPLSMAALIICGTLAKHSAERRAAAEAQARAEYAKKYAAEIKAAAAENKRKKAAEAKQRIAATKQAAQEAKQAAQEQKRQERSARAAEAHALKVARAAELAELAERRLQAEKELAALHETPAQAQPAAEQPAETPENHSEPEQAQPAAQVFTLDQFAQAAAPAPQPFKGHTVAFTGRLTISGLTHAQAREKVKQAGGQAFAKEMPSFTTLLVVGDNPGMKKQDKADAWISQVKKITEQQFLDMLAA